MHRSSVVAGALLLALLAAPVASADHHPGMLRHVSTGPTDANGANNATLRAVSEDGSRAFFVTNERLTSDDTDSQRDVYVRTGDTVALVSIGPAGGNGAFDADLSGITPNGAHAYVVTTEQLTADDTDGSQDVYDRFLTDPITLVSTGPLDGGADSGAAFFAGASDNGGRVFFTTIESLVSEDTDGYRDVYERAAETTTTLLSIGSTGGNGPKETAFHAASTDGTRVIFGSIEQLVAGDTDSAWDIYERHAGTTTLLSASSFGGNAEQHVTFDGASADATRVFFNTFEALEAADIDNSQDIYERAGGATTRISTGPQGGNGTAWPSIFVGSSEDGTRVFMNTRERHVAADTDFWNDVYVRHGNTTELLSVGPIGGTAAIQAIYRGASADGTKVWFETTERLTSDDSGTGQDVYENASGTTSLISTGPNDSGAYSWFGGAARDGGRVFFHTTEALTAADDDTLYDVYERTAATTTLVSVGPTRNAPPQSADFLRASADGTHVFFMTSEAMLPSDADAAIDLYEARSGYEVPQVASVIDISLVPELRQTISNFQCQARGGINSSHGPPLAFSSCQPPAYLPNTMARMGPEGRGSAQLTAVPGDPGTSADEADLAIAGSVSDVRAMLGGGDYDPSLAGADVTLGLRLRLTDSANGPLLSDPATTVDFELKAPAACLPTLGPEGSDCSVNTSADALNAGSILEGRRMVLQSYDLRFRDSGANAVRGDGDDRAFAMRGIYVP